MEHLIWVHTARKVNPILGLTVSIPRQQQTQKKSGISCRSNHSLDAVCRSNVRLNAWKTAETPAWIRPDLEKRFGWWYRDFEEADDDGPNHGQYWAHRIQWMQITERKICSNCCLMNAWLEVMRFDCDEYMGPGQVTIDQMTDSTGQTGTSRCNSQKNHKNHENHERLNWISCNEGHAHPVPAFNVCPAVQCSGSTLCWQFCSLPWDGYLDRYLLN